VAVPWRAILCRAIGLASALRWAGDDGKAWSCLDIKGRDPTPARENQPETALGSTKVVARAIRKGPGPWVRPASRPFTASGKCRGKIDEVALDCRCRTGKFPRPKGPAPSQSAHYNAARHFLVSPTWRLRPKFWMAASHLRPFVFQSGTIEFSGTPSTKNSTIRPLHGWRPGVN